MSIRVLLVAAMVAACLAVVPATFGKSGDVLVRGVCSKASTSKLKLSPKDGRLEVEFEVDQNRNGVRWTVVLSHNASVVFRGTMVTGAPSGSFELRRVISDAAGRDRVGARATSPSGEVCEASATI